MINLNDLQKYRHEAGVYGLYKKEELVYVGTSNNVYMRILEHFYENKKSFDSIKVNIDNNITFNEISEVYIIAKLKPKYNKLVASSAEDYIKMLPSQIKETEAMKNLIIRRKSLLMYFSEIDFDMEDFEEKLTFDFVKNISPDIRVLEQLS